MNIVVRAAISSDAEPIAILSRQSFYDTFAAFNSKEDMDLFLSDAFNVQRLVAETQDPRNIFLVAMQDDRMLGYAKLIPGSPADGLMDESVIEIARIYAAKDAIGLGVGKALMQACLQIAKDKNHRIIWLGVWEQNERAISFYKNFGFEKFGEHPFVLGRDVQTDWLMKKMV